MSHKPTPMKTLHHFAQKPMLHSEVPIKPSTMDSRHAKEQERRSSSIQRTTNLKPKARP